MRTDNRDIKNTIISIYFILIIAAVLLATVFQSYNLVEGSSLYVLIGLLVAVVVVHFVARFFEYDSDGVQVVVVNRGLLLAEYFNYKLLRDESVLHNIENIWKQHVRTELLQVNKDQALIPSKAKVLMNKLGTAPGMWMEKGEKVFISLPGVPYEMNALVENEVVPKLKDKYKCPYILHKTLLVYGLGESALAARIEVWEDALPKHIKLAYLPNLGLMRLRLSTKGFGEQQVKNEVQEQIDKVIPLIKDEDIPCPYVKFK